MELTSNFQLRSCWTIRGQVRKLRPRLAYAVPSRRSEIFDSVTMNFGDRVQQFFKPQLPSARS